MIDIDKNKKDKDNDKKIYGQRSNKMKFVTQNVNKIAQNHIVTTYIRENPEKYILLDDNGIKSLQDCLLKMLKEFSDFCIENNLRFAILGGCLLGKIRHNGFIPWDDDVDIIMPREDFDRLKVVLPASEINKKYMLKGPGCLEGADFRCMKLYKRNSLLKEAFARTNCENKIFIDIMPVDKVPENRIHRTLKGLYCDLLIGLIGCVEYKQLACKEMKQLMKSSFAKKVNHCIRTIVGTVLSIRSLDKWYKVFDRASVYNKQSKLLTIVTGKLFYFGEIVSEEVLYPFKKDVFCGVDVWIPNKPENYLEHRYGDYMVIPDESHREGHYVEKIMVDTNVSLKTV